MRRLAGSLVVALALVVGLTGTGGAGAQETGAGGGDDNGGAVVGGQPADPGEHPFQVAVVYDPAFWGDGDPLLNQFCGGTLIAPDMVLTAGHCAIDAWFGAQELDESIVGVLAGVEDLDAAETEDLIPVDGASLHPGFFFREADDVGLLHLAEPIEGIDPVRLATPEDAGLFDAGSPTTVLGWGNMSGDPNVPHYATTLQEGEVDVVDDTDCYEAYRQNARAEIDVERTLCAAAPGVDACDGDSGGALVADDGGEPVQVGIVWSGIGCAEPLYPGLYVRVARHAEDIQAVLDEPFSDIDFSHPFLWEIAGIAAAGIADGFPDGTFRPSTPVSRAALAAYLYRFAGEPTFVPPSTPSFSDVRSTHPFFLEVEWLASEGIANGYGNGTFRPARAVSRSAMAAYLYRFAGSPGLVEDQYFDDVSPQHPFFGEIGWAAETGIMQGTFIGEDEEDFSIVFRPAAATSRQAMAAFLARFHELVPV
jgi:hypothetical protein